MSDALSKRVEIRGQIQRIKSKISDLESNADKISLHRKQKLMKELDQLRHQYRQI